MAHKNSSFLSEHLSLSPSLPHTLWLSTSQLFSIPWICHILSCIQAFTCALHSTQKTLLHLFLPSSLTLQVTAYKLLPPGSFLQTTTAESCPFVCVHIYIIKQRLGCYWQFVMFTVPVIQCEWKPCLFLCFYGQTYCLTLSRNSISTC